MKIQWNSIKKSFVTYILLAINIIVYIYMLIRFKTTENSYVLLTMGANFTPFIIAGEWWRLITASFIHIGFEHILFNGLSLYYLGKDIEWILGPWRFVFIYIAGAIGGNLFSMAFSLNISAGASTGIFALFAAYIILGKLNPRAYSLISRATTYLILLILQFINGFLSSGVDNWGHFGGVVYGALATLVVAFSSENQLKRGRRVLAFIAMVILGIILFLIGKYILLA